MINQKARALFFLGRYVNKAEDIAEFDHEMAARKGMGYQERIERAKEAEKMKSEAEALRWAYNQIASLPDE